MKLFKSLLVARDSWPLAPLSATANEVTINDVNPVEELAVTNNGVDGLGRLNNLKQVVSLRQQLHHSQLILLSVL